MLNEKVVQEAIRIISSCDLFVSIGTSAVVYPAAGFPSVAKDSGAYCIEINPEKTELSHIYNEAIREKASIGLEVLKKQITD